MKGFNEESSNLFSIFIGKEEGPETEFDVGGDVCESKYNRGPIAVDVVPTCGIKMDCCFSVFTFVG